MATVHKEIIIDTAPDSAWDALRDWRALHERLVPGFAIGVRVEGDDRVVTFFSGIVLRERIVTVDDTARRLVWSVVDGPYRHHSASAQVFPIDGGSRTRFVWVADLLPDEAAERTAALMQQGIETVRRTLERHSTGRGTPEPPAVS